ncbi:MAG: hypothetical protein M3527_10970 [Actinomycetota bacterium]|nr:hypothetical protein [Acidimicrobiia bacterium]MDQ3294950.1 hypothetical protein [Actinomycetota bacterium]
MDDITGITQMGMQLVAGDSRPCAGSGRSISASRPWSGTTTHAQADFAAANGTKPATPVLVDMPSTQRHRQPRGTP